MRGNRFSFQATNDVVFLSRDQMRIVVWPSGLACPAAVWPFLLAKVFAELKKQASKFGGRFVLIAGVQF